MATGQVSRPELLKAVQNLAEELSGTLSDW